MLTESDYHFLLVLMVILTCIYWVDIYYHNSNLVQRIGSFGFATDHQIKQDTKHWVWSIDLRLATRRDPTLCIKLLLWWNIYYMSFHKKVNYQRWQNYLLFNSTLLAHLSQVTFSYQYLSVVCIVITFFNIFIFWRTTGLISTKLNLNKKNQTWIKASKGERLLGLFKWRARSRLKGKLLGKSEIGWDSLKISSQKPNSL